MNFKTKKRFFIPFVFFLLIIFAVFVYSWINLRSTIYRHTSADVIDPSMKSLLQHHTFYSTDDVKLSGWYLPVKNAKATVILVHGLSQTTGGKTSMIPHVHYLTNAGYSVFLIDLRSFGGSENKRKAFGTEEWQDIEGAYDYMKSKPENKNKLIGFLGHSMGASASIIASGRTGKGDFIVADVPFASPKKFFITQIKEQKLPPGFLIPFVDAAARIELGFDYNNISAENYISKVTAPTLLISAKRDTAVDPNDPRELYAKTTVQSKLIQIDASHDVIKDKPKEFEEQVLQFLSNTIK